jgi:hypothetical protein
MNNTIQSENSAGEENCITPASQLQNKLKKAFGLMFEKWRNFFEKIKNATDLA